MKCRYSPGSSIELTWEEEKLKIYSNKEKLKLNVSLIKEYDVLQQKINDESLV